jgi:hypothetical protein
VARYKRDTTSGAFVQTSFFFEVGVARLLKLEYDYDNLPLASFSSFKKKLKNKNKKKLKYITANGVFATHR